LPAMKRWLAVLLVVVAGPVWGKLGGTPAELGQIYGKPDEWAADASYAIWMQQGGAYQIRAEFRGGRCVWIKCSTRPGELFEVSVVPRLMAAFTGGVALQAVPSGGTNFGGVLVRPSDARGARISAITPVGRMLVFERSAETELEGDALVALVETEARRITR
jgi:hypothetical protein